MISGPDGHEFENLVDRVNAAESKIHRLEGRISDLENDLGDQGNTIRNLRSDLDRLERRG